MKHILVATDGSEDAGRAIDFAADLVKACGGRLTVLTVGGNVSRDELGQLARAEGGIAEALDLLANRVLLEAGPRARRGGASEVRTQIAWGDPAQAIIDAARREHADAIVLGRRGRGRLAGLLLGSVSQKLVSLAPCPVIVVP
jgi:nucleotide-binding universal stress UspA family protein